AVTGLARVFGADGVSIQLVDDGVLAIRSALGLSDEARRDRKRIGEGISGFVASTGQPLLLRGPIVGDERFTGNDPSIADALVAPLRAGDQVIGVVSLKRRGSAPPYESADLDSLSIIGADIAATLSFVDAIARAEEDRGGGDGIRARPDQRAWPVDRGARARPRRPAVHRSRGRLRRDRRRVPLRPRRRRKRDGRGRTGDVRRAPPYRAGAARRSRAGAHGRGPQPRRRTARIRAEPEAARPAAREGDPRGPRDPGRRPAVHGRGAADRAGR